MDQVVASAFLDELGKIAFADSHMNIPKSREGRRPISVDKLLDKDKKGELYKQSDVLGALFRAYDSYLAKAADSQGNPQDKGGVLGGPWAPLIRSGAGALAGGALGAWAGKPGTGALIGGGLGLGASAVHSRLESQHDMKELRDRVQRLEKSADSAGNPQDTAAGSVDDPGAAKAKKHPGDGPTQGTMIPLEAKYGSLRKAAMGQGGVFSEGPSAIPTGESPNMNPEAKKPRKKGDVPSMDDSNSVDRYDQRENATTVTGLGQTSSNIGAGNQPGEHA